eukprot:m.136740 g.136740  ORF g.136740 m.136740 type:complete len:638 (-) comp29877_c1_seq1:119-2032(-)
MISLTEMCLVLVVIFGGFITSTQSSAFDRLRDAGDIVQPNRSTKTEPTEPFPTESGPIEGEVDEDGFKTFHGVPFALPPLGNRRWLDLLPPYPWSDTRQTVVKGPMCPQLDFIRGEFVGQEDCLYLSIYVPKACTKETPCPVMQWIYGGAWIIGGNTFLNKYDGTKLAKAHNIVIVAANYRLDVLGWLAVQELQDERDDGVYGNYGLRDQRYAMQWTRRNIENFGGDVSKMTLFGESAGGFSVCQHLVSPASNQLFSNAIIESGDCSGPWAIFDGPSAKEFGDLFVKDVGCPIDNDPRGRAACLRSLPLHKLMEPYLSWLCPVPRPNDPWCNRTIPTSSPSTSSSLLPFNSSSSRASKWPINRPAFAPMIGFAAVVDGTDEGLPDFPQQLMEQGKINVSPSGQKINVMMGTNEHELAMFMIAVYLVLPSFTVAYPFNEATMEAVLKHLVAYIPGLDPDVIWATIQNVYPKREYKTEIFRLVEAGTDALFRCGTRRSADTLADHGHDVYTYSFNMQDHEGYKDPTSLYCELDIEVGCGVPHEAEIKYVFMDDSVKEEAGVKLSERMAMYWANFAKTGDPNSAETQLRWPLHERASDLYLMFGERDQLLYASHKRGCDFWDTLFPPSSSSVNHTRHTPT